MHQGDGRFVPGQLVDAAIGLRVENAMPTRLAFRSRPPAETYRMSATDTARRSNAAISIGSSQTITSG
jgi:hypothetical protein